MLCHFLLNCLVLESNAALRMRTIIFVLFAGTAGFCSVYALVKL